MHALSVQNLHLSKFWIDEVVVVLTTSWGVISSGDGGVDHMHDFLESTAFSLCGVRLRNT